MIPDIEVAKPSGRCWYRPYMRKIASNYHRCEDMQVKLTFSIGEMIVFARYDAVILYGPEKSQNTL